MSRIAPLVWFLLLAAACSNGAASPPPNPSAELRQAAQAMGSLKSVAADVKFGPGVTYQGFTLASATTRVEPPSTSDTVLKVKQQDFLVDIDVITVPGHVYIKVPFGHFSEIPAQEAADLPSLGALFDPAHGLPSILALGTGTARLGTEKVGGVDCDKISTTYTAAELGQAVGGFKPVSDVTATIWVAPGDHLVRRVLLRGALIEAGQTTSIQVDLHDFNAAVSITPPPVSPSASPS